MMAEQKNSAQTAATVRSADENNSMKNNTAKAAERQDLFDGISKEDEQGINEILHHFDNIFYDEIMGGIIESMPKKPDGATRIEILISQYRIFFLRGFEMALKLACYSNAADTKEGVTRD